MLRVHYALKYFENPKIINKNTIQNFGPLAGSTQNRTQKHPLGRTHVFRPTPCSIPPCLFSKTNDLLTKVKTERF